MKLINISIAAKLVVGFGSVLVIVAAGSVFTSFQIRGVSEIQRLNRSSDATINAISRASGDLNGIRASVRKFVLTSNPSDKAKLESFLSNLGKDLDETQANLTSDGPAYLADLKRYRSALTTYLEAVVMTEAELASNPSSRQQAIEMVSSSATTPLADAVDSSFDILKSSVTSWSDLLTDQAARAMDRIELVIALSGLSSILIGAAMAWLITRAISRPLSAMTDTMFRLSAGDHTVVIPGLDRSDEVGKMAAAVQTFKDGALQKIGLERQAETTRRLADEVRGRSETERAYAARDQASVVNALAKGLDRLSAGQLLFRIDDAFAPEYEKLRNDFNGAMAQLQDTMKIVSGNTTAIQSGTDEISSAADDLSRRTEQQAASLEETAAALDEITATVRKTAEGSKHARDVVGNAKVDAEQSSVVVRRAIEAMRAIEKSSDQIGQIIGVIDEIAFQTNLLALNAGVEAARAGDAGRGFAVVASEVRALAQRSADAAKEIKTLISASSAQVGEGVELVAQTGHALERILLQVTEINGIVRDIAASAQEQANGLDLVNKAVNQMDQVTQQNAAMVEESTAASHALARETEELARLIGRFEVEDVNAIRGREAHRTTSRSIGQRGAS